MIDLATIELIKILCTTQTSQRDYVDKDCVSYVASSLTHVMESDKVKEITKANERYLNCVRERDGSILTARKYPGFDKCLGKK